MGKFAESVKRWAKALNEGCIQSLETEFENMVAADIIDEEDRTLQEILKAIDGVQLEKIKRKK